MLLEKKETPKYHQYDETQFACERGSVCFLQCECSLEPCTSLQPPGKPAGAPGRQGPPWARGSGRSGISGTPLTARFEEAQKPRVRAAAEAPPRRHSGGWAPPHLLCAQEMTPPRSGGRWRTPCCQSLGKGWASHRKWEPGPGAGQCDWGGIWEVRAQAAETSCELEDQPRNPGRTRHTCWPDSGCGSPCLRASLKGAQRFPPVSVDVWH